MFDLQYIKWWRGLFLKLSFKNLFKYFLFLNDLNGKHLSIISVTFSCLMQWCVFSFLVYCIRDVFRVIIDDGCWALTSFCYVTKNFRNARALHFCLPYFLSFCIYRCVIWIFFKHKISISWWRFQNCSRVIFVESF